MFWEITVGLFVIAFLWALFSLRRELSTPHNIHAKRRFAKEKILFRAK